MEYKEKNFNMIVIKMILRRSKCELNSEVHELIFGRVP